MDNTKKYTKGPISPSEQRRMGTYKPPSSPTKGRGLRGSTNLPVSSTVPQKNPSEIPSLPRHFGSLTASKPDFINPVKPSKERLTQLTASSVEKTKEPTKEEQQKKKEVIEDRRRNFDENWYEPIGRRPDLPSTEDIVPTRYSVRPPQRNTFELIEGAPDSAFYIPDEERLKSTKKSVIDLKETTSTEIDKQIKAQKEEFRLERLRKSQFRAEGNVFKEDSSKLESKDKRLYSKANQLQSYLDAVAKREARGGL